MESTEIKKQAELEGGHWWYRERRQLIAREVRGVAPGRALDIGAGAGGNTQVLLDRGWDAVAVEYSEDGAEVARQRGIPVLQADALALPVADGVADLVMAYDVLEHLDDDEQASREMLRVLRRGGRALVAVPADPALWSAHDDAVGHVRRYTRETLVAVVQRAGFAVEEVRSWNVLLRPAAAWHRHRCRGSDITQPPRVLNAALGAVVALERWVPVHRAPGVSLLLRATRP